MSSPVDAPTLVRDAPPWGDGERASPFPPGTLLADRYRVEDCLGRGGMGIVYRAEHVLMGKPVALKVLHPELGAIEELQKRFEREAKSSSLLSQENIVNVTDYGKTDEGVPFLVMELLSGTSLSMLLKQEKRFRPSRAVAFVAQVLRGLAHAHGRGVIHRDLKPDNIMCIAEEGREIVKLLDFGIAKLVQPGGQGLTQAGVVFGTPEYMAPEQALGEDVDGRADLYAVGVILYELLTGQKPFASSNQVEVLSMHLVRPVIPPRVVAPDANISEGLEQVVLKALQKKRELRFASAEEFLRALEASPHTSAATSTSELSTASVRTGKRRRARLRSLRGWQRRFAMAAGLVGLLGLLVVVALFARPAQQAATPVVISAVEKLVEKKEAPLLADRVARARESLEANRLAEARALLLTLLSDAPDLGVVHLLLGHMNMLERKPETALADYKKAIGLDESLSQDAVLMRNASELFGAKDRNLAEAALELLAKMKGSEAERLLVRTASSDRRREFRWRAREACKERRCLREVDLVASYGLDLEQGKTCKERQAATEALLSLRDKRALGPLRKALRARGGFLNLAQTNRCIEKTLREGISQLEGS